MLLSETKRLVFERPHLYRKQRAAIFEPRRISAIEASTKSGKTAGSIVWLSEQALAGREGWNYWWVAPVGTQAQIAFRRMWRSFPRELVTVGLGEKTITLMNGAVVWFKSADHPDSLYGEDVHAAVIDEASRCKEDSWHAVRSTLTYTRGPIRIIGNVKGRKNWFFHLCRRGEKGDDPDIGYHRITADDAVEAGVLDPGEIDEARSILPENVFRELYMAEASDDGGNPFGIKHIEGCVVPKLSDGDPEWWGWDLAKKQDYTVGVALDRVGYVCRFVRLPHNMPWPDIIKTIVRETGATPALIDSTGVGDPIVDHLQTMGHNYEGYHFTPASKQKLMEGLAVVIQSRGVTFPPGPLVQELMIFEYEHTRTGVRYSAPEGYNDDCVCALALAEMCRSTVTPMLRVTPAMVAAVRNAPRRRGFR